MGVLIVEQMVKMDQTVQKLHNLLCPFGYGNLIFILELGARVKRRHIRTRVLSQQPIAEPI